jgi:NAD-dependent deacetylase
VTGAGISRASGIPTFRGSEKGAVWKTSDVSLATFACFQRDPALQWKWYLDRFSAVAEARPNDAHRALAELEHWQIARQGRFLLVTQNIDTLHEEAGSKEMIKVHGTSDRVRCSRPGCENGAPSGSLPRDAVDFEAFRGSGEAVSLPVCPHCDAYLRAHVLFFDEYYQEHTDYRFAEVVKAATEADLVLFVGTSFSVGVTDLVLRSAAARDVPTFSIDPSAEASGHGAGDLGCLAEKAEIALPALCRQLGVSPAGTASA